MAYATFAPVLDAIRGLSWPARRRAKSAVPGPHISRTRGTTAEVIEYRPYRQGDDPRRIDWKLLARTDRVYVRLSEERTIVPTIVVLDASASMAFPVPTHDKWMFARLLSLGLAEVARRGGDPVGMTVVHADTTCTIPPRSRRTVLDEMMRAVDIAPAGSSPLAPAVTAATRHCARLVIVSDFLGDDEAVLSSGRAFLAGGGEVHAVHVVDRSELDPDPKQRLLTDPEQPDLRRPMPSRSRAEYIRRFAEWRETLAREWRHAGARYAMVVPGAEPIRGTIRRLVTPGL
jgi:uncharacterized protein (DUF58 family)